MVGKLKARVVAARSAVPPPVTQRYAALLCSRGTLCVSVCVCMYVYVCVHVCVYVSLLEHRLNGVTVVSILSRAPSSLGPAPCGHIHTAEHMSE